MKIKLKYIMKWKKIVYCFIFLLLFYLKEIDNSGTSLWEREAA